MMQLDIQHEPELIRQAQSLLGQTLGFAGFLMRSTCRGFAGRQARAKDISVYSSKGGKLCLTRQLPQPIGRPDGMNLSGALLYKKAQGCINRAAYALSLSVWPLKRCTRLTGMVK